MKVLIVYHKVDLDGVFSAAVAKMKYESKGYECVLYPWTYGDSMDGIEEKVAGDIDILTLVDLSFPDNERKLLEFNELCPSGVVWIDHHVTEIEHYKDARIRGKRKIGTSACELTWKYMFPNRDVPLLIQYLSAYDVWNKDRFEWDDVMAVQYAMRGRVGLNVKSAQNYLEYYRNETNELQLSFMDGLIKEGASILGYLSRKNKSECELYSFETEFMGFKAICMNTLDFNSTTFESVWDPSKYDLMLPFAVKSNGKVRCSLYTTKPEINCGEIAKALGGGGHRQAAGFELDFDSEQFQSLIQNNKLIIDMRKNYEIGTIVVFKRDNQVYIGGFDGYYKEGTKNFVRLKSVFYEIYSGNLFYNNHSWQIFPSVINEQLRKATEEEINCYFELLNEKKSGGNSESKLMCSLSFDVDKGNPIEDDVNKIFSLTLKEVNGEPYIFLHSKDKNGLSSYSLNDFVTAININSVVKHLKLKINE